MADLGLLVGLDPRLLHLVDQVDDEGCLVGVLQQLLSALHEVLVVVLLGVHGSDDLSERGECIRGRESALVGGEEAMTRAREKC